jgi:hypothetical protein
MRSFAAIERLHYTERPPQRTFLAAKEHKERKEKKKREEEKGTLYLFP